MQNSDSLCPVEMKGFGIFQVQSHTRGVLKGPLGQVVPLRDLQRRKVHSKNCYPKALQAAVFGEFPKDPAGWAEP